ncbi:Cytochrome P450 71A23 [Triticum urartu]|uniref:Cytochrome P450 71A23 n=1 Tax=Triticum urartu TaxID=4572 RepID=M7ZEH5_TRIUA|nr:Cytochrome P450 71A23 [Triticum urartu]
MLTSYSNAVIKRAAFGDGEYGIDGDDGGEKLRKVLDDFEELLGTPTVGEFVPWLAWVDTLTGLNARVTRTFEALDGLLERVIADHRKRRLAGGPVVGGGEDDRRDFVDVLLDVSETGEEAGGVRFDVVSIKAIMLISIQRPGSWRMFFFLPLKADLPRFIRLPPRPPLNLFGEFLAQPCQGRQSTGSLLKSHPPSALMRN